MAKKAGSGKTDPAAVAPDSGIILQLDPQLVLADDNTRFNLKESRVQSLAESIISQGGVIEPVEVEPLTEPSPEGHTYRLTLGFYRHAAVKYLNTTQAAGLTLPAIVHVTADATDRLKRQLAENIERENQSPMDIAIAIKRLMDAGIARIDVRQMFCRPGSRKGAKGKPEPASNAFVNMMLSFLDLPKTVQEKIHLGTVGVAAAYQLTKVDKDQQAKILVRAEEDRQKLLEQEEKEEEKFLTQEKKTKEKNDKVEAARDLLIKAESKAKNAATALETQTTLVTELFAVSKGKHTNPKEKKAADTAFKDAEKKRVTLEETATEAQKEHEKAQVAFSKLTEEKKPTKAQTTKAKPITSDEVKKAAKESGAQQGAVPLNASEMRKVVIDMSLPTGDAKDAKLIAIGESLKKCFAGISTPEAMYKEVKKIAG